MPQLIALALAGAGLYAGYKWLTREIVKAGDEVERAREDMLRRAAEASGSEVPKDLGALEWDEAAGVYRPRKLN